MFYSLKGKISFQGENFIVLEINGTAYQIFVTDFLLERVKLGGILKLFTYLYLREDTIELYGFETLDELEYFKRLNAISGIGPKSAIGTLSLVRTRDLEKAILDENVTLLTKVSGIGKKTAERIILELKSKIEKGTGTISSEDSLVIDALVKMGYTLSQARGAIRKIPEEIRDTKKRVKEALKILSR